MRSQTCSKTANFSSSHYRKDTLNCTRRLNLNIFMTAVLQAVLSRYQKPAFLIWNPNNFFHTVQFHRFTDPSKPYLQLHPSFQTPHPSTITLRVLEKHMLCRLLLCCLHATVFRSRFSTTCITFEFHKFWVSSSFSTSSFEKAEITKSNMVFNG